MLRSGVLRGGSWVTAGMALKVILGPKLLVSPSLSGHMSSLFHHTPP